MVLASGIEGDMVLGTMGPGHGVTTIENGGGGSHGGLLARLHARGSCRGEGIIDPRFDLTEMQATTHCTAPLVVNGPARHNCGPIASGTGALGQGVEPALSIGRALRLTMINIGKARAARYGASRTPR